MLRATFAVGLLLTSALSLAAADEFQLQCTLPEPLKTVGQHRSIDKKCAPTGKAGPGEDPLSAAHEAQNRAKNNLCATGTPVTLTRTNFSALEQETRDLKGNGQLEYGGEDVPSDRSVLTDLISVSGVSIGEGTLVRYVGIISKAQHSNVGKGKGESVNCHYTTAPDNDIHLTLVTKTTDSACKTITAEMIPHYRPAAWFRLAGIGATKSRTNPLGSTPVRITGQLFFDGSHTACGETGGRPMSRLTNWEIHPVYSIDVCTEETLAACSADDDSVWTPLHEADPNQ